MMNTEKVQGIVQWIRNCGFQHDNRLSQTYTENSIESLDDWSLVAAAVLMVQNLACDDEKLPVASSEMNSLVSDLSQGKKLAIISEFLEKHSPAEFRDLNLDALSPSDLDIMKACTLIFINAMYARPKNNSWLTKGLNMTQEINLAHVLSWFNGRDQYQHWSDILFKDANEWNGAESIKLGKWGDMGAGNGMNTTPVKTFPPIVQSMSEEQVYESPLKAVLDSPVSRHQSEIRSRDCQIRRLNGDINTCRYLLDEATAQNKALEEELAKEKSANCKLRTRYHRLKQENEKYLKVDSPDTKDDLYKKIALLKKEKKELSDQLEDFGRMQKELAETTETLRKTEAGNEDFGKKLISSKNRIQNLMTEQEYVQQNLELRNRELEKTLLEVKEKDRQISDMVDELEAARQEIMRLEGERNKLRPLVEEKGHEVAELKTHLKEEKELRAQAEKQSNKMNQHLTEKLVIINSKKSALKLVEAEKQDLTDQLRSLTEQRGNWEIEKKRLCEEKKRLCDRVDSLEAQFKSAQEAIDIAEDAKRTAAADANSFAKRLDQAHAAMLRAESSAKNQIEELERDLSAERAARNLLEAAGSKLEAELRTVEKREEHTESEKKALKDQLHSAVNARQDTEKELEQLRFSSWETTLELEEKVDGLVTKQTENAVAIEQERKEQQEVTDALTEANEKLVVDLEQYRLMLEERDQEIQYLAEQLLAIGTLRTELEDIRQEMRSMSESFRRELECLTESIGKMETEKTVLSDRVVSLGDQLEESEKKRRKAEEVAAEEKKQLTVDLERSQQRLHEGEVELKSLSERIDAEKQILEDRVVSLVEQIVELEGNLITERTALSASEETETKLQEELQNVLKRSNEVEEEVIILKEQLDRDRETAEKEKECLLATGLKAQTQFEQRIAELSAEQQRLIVTIDDERMERKQMTDTWIEEKTQLTDDLEHSQLLLQEKDAELRRLEQELSVARDKLNRDESGFEKEAAFNRLAEQRMSQKSECPSLMRRESLSSQRSVMDGNEQARFGTGDDEAEVLEETTVAAASSSEATRPRIMEPKPGLHPVLGVMGTPAGSNSSTITVEDLEFKVPVLPASIRRTSHHPRTEAGHNGSFLDDYQHDYRKRAEELSNVNRSLAPHLRSSHAVEFIQAGESDRIDEDQIRDGTYVIPQTPRNPDENRPPSSSRKKQKRISEAFSKITAKFRGKEDLEDKSPRAKAELASNLGLDLSASSPRYRSYRTNKSSFRKPEFFEVKNTPPGKKKPAKRPKHQ